MKKTPEIIFVVDGIYEAQAVKEASTLGIPCYAIFNTNGNPFIVEEAIPANTNSVKSLDYLALALKEAFKGVPKKTVEKETPKKTEKETTPESK